MIPESWRGGEIAVIGMGRSGRAAARFLEAQGLSVYLSDAADSDELREVAQGLTNDRLTVDIGHHDLKRIANACAVITSPGVPPSAPPLRAARDAGAEILAELDLAAMFLGDTRLIVVTGTNGKTTTTALLAHILAASGGRELAAGNIGLPLIEVAGQPPFPAWLAVEASSFQLHDAPHLDPTIGVVTNLSPDHLDRYASVAEYYADKRNLFRNASADSVWVLNADDPAVLELAAGVAGRHLHWSLAGDADAYYDRTSSDLMLHGRRLLPRSDLSLLGDHNVANALAAALAADAANVEADAIRAGVSSFIPLPNRLEPVREIAGVLWINDSKATNVSSAIVALQAMTRPFVLIAGGRPKGDDFSQLNESMQSCRSVVAYGEAASAIVDAVQSVARAAAVTDFEDAVELAAGEARSGDVVLLSPACASFDQFDNYERRGQTFRQLVEAM
ncbi:MAG: UDP-N-acetylmuramoyl-L-alanine--D-glutamate ligase [Gemmatimonadota bacterium]|nr:MAG: UDP-N-acetylmuramoyl-L-alanine--D-glutamate ligase [Gemmatimonadota bacterium]